MRHTTFLYCLCEPGTRTVRYVGKSDNPKGRLSHHIAEAKRGSQIHVSRWIRQLGARPDLFVIGEIPRLGWESFEVNAIAAARALGMSLTNITDGGEGISGYPSPRKGKSFWSKEQRKQIGDVQRGIPKPPRTPEHIHNNANSQRGTKQPGASSRYIGVCFDARCPIRPWKSCFRGAGKRVYLGCFSLEEAAARAYDEQAKKYLGEQAKLNFPG